MQERQTAKEEGESGAVHGVHECMRSECVQRYVGAISWTLSREHSFGWQQGLCGTTWSTDNRPVTAGDQHPRGPPLRENQ